MWFIEMERHFIYIKLLKMLFFFVVLQKISPKEKYNGKPVVPREPLSGKMEVKNIC